MRLRVEAAVQPVHGDGLGVDDLEGGPVLPLVLPGQQRQRLRQHVVGLGLAAHRVADDHDAVADQDQLVELDDLVQEPLGWLQVELLALSCGRLSQLPPIHLDGYGAGEEIAHDTLEGGEIGGHELGQVHVQHHAVDDLLLAVALERKSLFLRLKGWRYDLNYITRIGDLESRDGVDDGLDSSHAILVMGLVRQLFGTKP